MTKVLIASIVRQHPEVFKAFLRTVQWQRLPADVSATILIVLDPECDNFAENEAHAREAGCEVRYASKKPEGAQYAVNSSSHHWTIPTFHWLAREKEAILHAAREARYDAVWLLDSDLLLAPTTLASLLATGKEVVSGVFWTRWTPEAAPLPQVWAAHPYEFQGRGYEAHEFLRRVAERDLLQVGGLGACTLIRSSVLDRVHYWPLLEGLPSHSMWQGEDRHFCVRAERAHVELWADCWPSIWHCYRPEDRSQIEAVLQELATSPQAPQHGDEVSLLLEPCEEPKLAGHREHVRGRLGTLPLLPELEQTARTLIPGDSALVRCRMPLWHDIPEYRGRSKVIKITLLDARPAGLAPTLRDFHNQRGTAALVESFMEPAAAAETAAT